MKNPTIHDPYPNYRPAGYRPVTLDEGTQYSLKPEERQGPGTPEHIKKYRKSEKNAFGKTITHYGKVDDVLPPDSHTYGLVTADSIHVPQVLTDKGTEGVKGYMRDIREENYQRNLKEPLGKAGSRNYAWPTKTEDPNFKFGVSTNMSESAKDVMYTLPVFRVINTLETCILSPMECTKLVNKKIENITGNSITRTTSSERLTRLLLMK